MPHPLIPAILDLAHPVAAELNLTVVDAVFHTNQRPPVLRIDIRNPATDTGLEDCERMSRAFEEILDSTDLIPEAYVLEVSSPGLSKHLSSDRDFISFRGFAVLVRTQPPFQGQSEWSGNLIGRDSESVKLTVRGRTVHIPQALIIDVQLKDGS